MRVTFNKVAYTILFCYFVTACYTGYILVKNRIWKEKYQQEKFRQMSGKLHLYYDRNMIKAIALALIAN